MVASSWDELDSRIVIEDLLDLPVINSSLFPDHFIFRLEAGKKYLGIADYFSDEAYPYMSLGHIHTSHLKKPYVYNQSQFVLEY